MFTMTNAAIGHAVHGRGKGWRKAVRFALTENPAGVGQHEPPPQIFRLIGEQERAEYDAVHPRAQTTPQSESAEHRPMSPDRRENGDAPAFIWLTLEKIRLLLRLRSYEMATRLFRAAAFALLSLQLSPRYDPCVAGIPGRVVPQF